MSIKAVHLELGSDLSTKAFIACLRRFIARRGKPSSIWSDHGSNFIGANCILKELYAFLLSRKTQETICNFAPLKELIGISYLRDRLTLEDSGRPQLRALKLTSHESLAIPNLILKKCAQY